MRRRSQFTNSIETLEKMLLMSASLIDGTAEADSIDGSDTDNLINGHGGDDFIHAGLGTNFVDGGDGFDTLLVPEGQLSDFTIERNPNGSLRVQGIDAATGADIDSTLVSVERIQFRDERIELSPIPPAEIQNGNLSEPTAPISSNDTFLSRVVELTNDVRRNHGLQDLTIDSTLQATAQLQSTNMAQQDFFSHTGKDGLQAWHRAKNLGYDYQTIGENIAAGQLTPEEVVQGWVNSPGHLANILNPQFTEIGVGYQHLENDTGVINYHHYWTQVFGAEAPTATPDVNVDTSDDFQPIELTSPVAVAETTTPEVQAPAADTGLSITEPASPVTAPEPATTELQSPVPDTAPPAEFVENAPIEDDGSSQTQSPENEEVQNDVADASFSRLEIPAPVAMTQSPNTDSNSPQTNDPVQQNSAEEVTLTETPSVSVEADADRPTSEIASIPTAPVPIPELVKQKNSQTAAIRQNLANIGNTNFSDLANRGEVFFSSSSMGADGFGETLARTSYAATFLNGNLIENRPEENDDDSEDLTFEIEIETESLLPKPSTIF